MRYGFKDVVIDSRTGLNPRKNFVLGKGKNNYIIAALRLLIIPCAIALCLKLLGMESMVLTALMMHAMPCGMNTIVFPRLVDEDCRAGASMTLISSLLAILTVPLLVAVFS